MKKTYLFWLLCGVLLLSSCGSGRLALKKSTAAALSSQLGLQIASGDDLTLFAEAAGWLGVPYTYGGMSKSGVDCSGFVCCVYKNVYHVELNRQVEAIYQKNCRKISLHALSPGDLIFFDTKHKRRKVNHVGIYLKNNTFIHASTIRGVVLSKITDRYYKERVVRGGKVKK